MTGRIGTEFGVRAPIRADLERAQEGLQSLRFKLASALFSGMPPGAKQVLEP